MSRWLRWGVLSLGAVLMLGGTGHFAGVAYRWWTRGAPDMRHAGWIVLVGVAQLTAGGLNVMASSGLARCDPLARRVSLVACALACVFSVVALPQLLDAPRYFQAAPVVYFFAHAALAARLVVKG